MIRRLFISLIMIIGMAATVASAPRQSAVDKFVNSRPISHAVAGVCVMDLVTGRVIAGNDVDRAMVTASTMKVLTGTTAMELLGCDFKFHTRVYAVGNIDRLGILHGDIVVEGGLDPTLGSRHFDALTSVVDTLVTRLQAVGIKGVSGEIVFDRSVMPDDPVSGCWMLEDVAEGYGTGCHAINFADNQMLVKFDYRAGGRYVATVEPAMSWLDLRCNVSMIATGDTIHRPGITSAIYRDGNLLALDGMVAHRKRGREDFSRRYACPAPHLVLRDSIAGAMHSAGLSLTMSPKGVSRQEADTTLLLDYASPELGEILKSMLFRSDNMYAEAVLRAIAMAADKPATVANGVSEVYRYWKSRGLDIASLSMKDGCGLARNDWATPQLLCDVLRLAYGDRGKAGCTDFSQLLPRAGREGSVRRLLRNTPLSGDIVLKSGSMGGVMCYAGYYPTREPRYAVVVMVNNFSSSRSDVMWQVQRLLLDLFYK